MSDDYGQMQLRLDRLLKDKAALISEFRKETSADVRQLIHKDIEMTNNVIERLMEKMERFSSGDSEVKL